MAENLGPNEATGVLGFSGAAAATMVITPITGGQNVVFTYVADTVSYMSFKIGTNPDTRPMRLEFDATFNVQTEPLVYYDYHDGSGYVPFDDPITVVPGINVIYLESWGGGTNGAYIRLLPVMASDFDISWGDIKLQEVLPVTTTTVEIEWIDSISAAATGNKIYRDDVEIADIANGVQIYQDATAETGTEYKYEVQAHDGAGDETTQEVEGDNMDYITTA